MMISLPNFMAIVEIKSVSSSNLGFVNRLCDRPGSQKQFLNPKISTNMGRIGRHMNDGVDDGRIHHDWPLFIKVIKG